ncbi:MAG: EamA family transporter [Candidatus Woesearchaeota archaeon]
MKTKPIAFILVINATLLTSFSQILLKLGVQKFTFSLSMLSNLFLITGIALYGVAAVMIIYALKNGELSVLYPVVSTSYIWVSILALFIFKETITIWKALGVLSIIGGVSLIGLGSREGKK